MAGHSKFKNIQHRKSAQDAKRARFFARHSREIMVAMREGGDNPDNNFRLRSAINAARVANLPKSNLLRLLSKPQKINDQDITYEGYGTEGIAIIVETTTDNKNRTTGQLRLAFSKHGGQLGQKGSVVHLFQRRSFVRYSVDDKQKEAILEKAMECKTLEDYQSPPDALVFLCAVEHGSTLANDLEKILKDKPQDTGMMWVPKNLMTPKKPENILHLIEECQNLDDIKNVATNASLVS